MKALLREFRNSYNVISMESDLTYINRNNWAELFDSLIKDIDLEIQDFDYIENDWDHGEWTW